MNYHTLIRHTYMLICGLLSFTLNTHAFFSTSTAEYLNRLEDVLLFEKIEQEMLKKNMELIKETKPKRQVIDDQLRKLIQDMKETKAKIQTVAQDLKKQISNELAELKAKKGAAQEMLDAAKTREVAESSISWTTRKVLDLTGYGERLKQYVNNWYQGDIDKKINDIAQLKKQLTVLEKEIANKQATLASLKTSPAFKKAVESLQTLLQSLKKQEEQLIANIADIQKTLIDKYVTSAQNLAKQRLTLFKRSKCSGTTPQEIKKCKAYLINRIKTKQAKLSACKQLSNNPTIKQVQACRVAYKKTK